MLNYIILQYSFCFRLRTLERGQNFNLIPWAHRSINKTKIPIAIPEASTTKIGATVTTLISILEGSLSGSFKTA